MVRTLARSPLVAARRCFSARWPLHGRGVVTNVANKTWCFEFDARDGALHAGYGLPAELASPEDAMGDFFDPISEHLRGISTNVAEDGPTPSKRSLQNTARTLQCLDDLRRRSQELVREERTMEALVLATTHWHFTSTSTETDSPSEERRLLLALCAQRNYWDRAPAVAAVAAGLLGPLALLPGALVVNEVIMRRVDKYGGLSKDSPSGLDLAKAVMKHHIFRMLYDRPRSVELDDIYVVDENIKSHDLQTSIADGSHGQHISGKFEC
eukprot:TRINITY_DN55325_c0_g1_i1.p1 TRINITY_DN55325_c0_g1~~TRINITY_DN55325_c0_g1_i1.p1  ORF type:complete len:268 (+),score=51.54 TRINITY_DN55325_c0_g1_i1:100-903(+)